MRVAGVAAALALVAAVVTASATAVVNGSPDGDAHPYVGAVVFLAPSGAFELCSGSLVAPTVLVTAAHCAPDGATVHVSFDPNARAVFPGFWPTGTFHADPGWSPGAAPGLPGFDSNDLAVVVLDSAPAVSRLAKVPAQGYDDTLSNKQSADIVGYGLQDPQVGPNPPRRFAVRMAGQAKVIPGGGKIGDEFLKISSSKAAICSGDSGGPNLQAGTDIILANSTFGPNTTCQAVAYSERLDTAHALAFLAGFGVVPTAG